jgi:hypothetical protein
MDVLEFLKTVEEYENVDEALIEEGSCLLDTELDGLYNDYTYSRNVLVGRLRQIADEHMMAVKGLEE